MKQVGTWTSYDEEDIKEDRRVHPGNFHWFVLYELETDTSGDGQRTYSFVDRQHSFLGLHTYIDHSYIDIESYPATRYRDTIARVVLQGRRGVFYEGISEEVAREALKKVLENEGREDRFENLEKMLNRLFLKND